jgi:group I intron endonuclease
MAFVYKIENLINGKCYIGSTLRPKHIRKYEHFSSLRKGNHYNSYLQKSFNKYGESSFKFTIVEFYKFPADYTKEYINDYLLGREYYFVEMLKPVYNIKKRIERGNSGYKHSEETKTKISESHKKRYNKPVKEKRPISGWKHTLEALEKISARSRQPDNITRLKQIQKINAEKRKGMTHSLESKFKIVQTKMGVLKTIEIYDTNGVFVTSCHLSTEASGVSRAAIANNLCGLSKSTKNYIFKYKDILQ